MFFTRIMSKLCVSHDSSMTNIKSPVTPTCMTLEYGSKPQHLVETYSGTEKTCKLCKLKEVLNQEPTCCE